MSETAGALRAGRPRAGGWARRQLCYRPFLVLLGLGLLVRVAAMVLYFPSWLQAYDQVRFARVSPTGIFDDYWMPAGYALFVRGLRALTSELWVAISIQHLIGLGVGTLIYLTVRRLGARPWLACVPAGFVFLAGDLLWTEHQLMAENFVTAFLAAGFACAVRGLVPRVDLRWLAAASALLMYAGLSRNVALVALPVFVLCTVAFATGVTSYRQWGRVLAAAALPALLVFGLYFGAYQVSNGRYLGLTDMSGWNIYSRAAPFADCSRFTPPAGTEALCETTPTGAREGSLGYEWDPSSRGQAVFPMEPATSSEVGSFGRAAILHQPLSYLRLVGIEALRYLDPSIEGGRPFGGLDGSIQSFGLVDPATREAIEAQLGTAYDDAQVEAIAPKVLSTYQNLFRLGGLLVGALVLFTLIGAFVARGPVRLGVILFGATALLLYLVPIATFAWEYRYGVQPQPFVVVSGTLGFAALLARRLPGLFEPIAYLGSSGGRRGERADEAATGRDGAPERAADPRPDPLGGRRARRRRPDPGGLRT